MDKFNLEIFFYKNVPLIIIAIAGGIASILLRDKEENLKSIFTELFLAAFAGLFVGQYCLESSQPLWLTCMACGISGIASKRILLAMQDYIFKVLPFGSTNSKEGD